MAEEKKKNELLDQPSQAESTAQQTAQNQSSTVQQAQNTLQQASSNGYQSKWQSQINDMMNQYMNRDKFVYDVNADALYQQLKDQYALMGQKAMMDTMGQASALTGGYGNSYAQSVGQQAYQGYVQQLNDRIPDFYQMALNQYLNEGDQLQNNLAMLMQQESVDYGQYRDMIGDQQWQESFDYGKARDEIADQQWRESFDYSKTQDAYSKLMQLMLDYHYEPTADELAAAGMTTAQKNAVMKPYYDYLAALAAAEEDSGRGGGGSGPYVPPTGPDNGGTGDDIWITYSDVEAEVNQLKQANATRQDINDHINGRVNSSNYKPNVNAEQDIKDLKTVKLKK